ncbi:MAG: hypothetical protein HQL69_20710, partial [Magnetococcales bacterium]|nr:hypothetical protein [Magnetococcales bacterium]
IGFGEHKARFGNHEQEEANFLFFPKTTGNRLLIACYLAVEFIMDSLVAMVERLGLKKKLKKLVRQSSSMFSMPRLFNK